MSKSENKKETTYNGVPRVVSQEKSKRTRCDEALKKNQSMRNTV